MRDSQYSDLKDFIERTKTDLEAKVLACSGLNEEIQELKSKNERINAALSKS